VDLCPAEKVGYGYLQALSSADSPYKHLLSRRGGPHLLTNKKTSPVPCRLMGFAVSNSGCGVSKTMWLPGWLQPISRSDATRISSPSSRFFSLASALCRRLYAVPCFAPSSHPLLPLCPVHRRASPGNRAHHRVQLGIRADRCNGESWTERPSDRKGWQRRSPSGLFSLAGNIRAGCTCCFPTRKLRSVDHHGRGPGWLDPCATQDGSRRQYSLEHLSMYIGMVCTCAWGLAKGKCR